MKSGSSTNYKPLPRTTLQLKLADQLPQVRATASGPIGPLQQQVQVRPSSIQLNQHGSASSPMLLSVGLKNPPQNLVKDPASLPAPHNEPVAPSLLTPCAAPTSARTGLAQMRRQAEREQVIMNLDNVIRAQLPGHVIIDYLMALQVAPHLVLTESDPVKFLQSCDFDARKAAERLVLYWKYRRVIFGDRAFRPINLTSNSALTQVDIDCFKNGHIRILPSDREDCPVLGFEPPRRLAPTLETNLRVAFYVGHIVAENDKSQTQGWVGMCFFNRDDPKYDEHALLSIRTVAAAFPTKVKALHFFGLPGCSAPGFPGVLREEFFREIPTFVHESANQNEFAASIAAHGLSARDFSHMDSGADRLNVSPSGQEQKPAAKPNSCYKPPPSMASECLVISSKHYKMMDKALDQMSQADKAMYQDALHGTSEKLRKKETNRDWFLRVENLDCSLAAKRLIRYWNLRTTTFGSQRYLALDQTGEGALGRTALSTLGKGFINLLPDDRNGCPVVFIDSSRLALARNSEESIHKCLFYMFSLLAENEQSQQGGATLLYYIHDSDPSILDFLELLVDALPIRFKAAHLLSLQSLPFDLQSRIKFAGEVCVHVAGTKVQLGAALEARGFERADLPKRLNGEWGYDKFVHWQELRTRFEWKIPSGLAGRSGEFDFSDIKPQSTLSAEEKTERQRRLNIIHSRRKRDRERVEIDVLHDEIMEKREKQKKLRRENEELEGLYRNAVALIRCNDLFTSHFY